MPTKRLHAFMLQYYAIAVPVIGGASLMLGAFSAFIIDANLVRSETGSRIPPRYLSAAMEDPSRLPYWLVVAGFVVYALCLPFTAMWQQQLTDELELSFDCSPVVFGGHSNDDLLARVSLSHEEQEQSNPSRRCFSAHSDDVPVVLSSL